MIESTEQFTPLVQIQLSVDNWLMITSNLQSKYIPFECDLIEKLGKFFFVLIATDSVNRLVSSRSGCPN